MLSRTQVSIVTTPEAHAVQLNSRQTGSQAIPAGQTSATVNITAVTDAKSFLVFGVSLNDENPENAQVTGQITNCSTTCDELTFQRDSTTGAVLINWYVVEFVSGVTVQRGNVTMDATTKNVTLTSITTSKSFPLTSYQAGGTTFAANDWPRAKITSSTNLQFSMPDLLADGVVEWQVVEYTDATVQTGDVSFGTNDASKTATITSVDTGKSWLIYTYETSGGGEPEEDMDENLIRGLITNATTLTFDRYDGTASSTIDLTWYVVEFTDGTTVQHDSKNFSTSQTQQDVTLTSEVETTWSIALGGDKMRGGKAAIETDNPGPGWFRFSFVDKDTLRIVRGTTQSEPADVGWFVIQFIGNATAVELSAFTATEYADGILLQWRTGWEVDNLGFHVYREAVGRRLRLTPALIAGSALMVGGGTELTAGRAYTWGDPDGLGTDRYWLEDVDLNGTRTWHGPVAVPQGALMEQRSVLTVQPSTFLKHLGWKLDPRSPLQRAVEAGTAVPLAVQRNGWQIFQYTDVVAAGMPPEIDPRRLQLFVDGRESLLLVRGDEDSSFDPGDTIEFSAWGRAARVYWLIEGVRGGKRIRPPLGLQ